MPDSPPSPLPPAIRPAGRRELPGTAPGLNPNQLSLMPCGPGRTFVTCTDFCEDQFRAVDIIDINEFLAEHRPPWSHVRWINVDGLADTQVLSALAEKYELHPLAMEDMVRPGTRSKAEFYPGDTAHLPRLFVFTRMISRTGEGTLDFEQIGFFLGRHTLITFQEARGDIWDLVRERIMRDGSALRHHDASYLMYALLDAIVDHCFPVVDTIGDEIEDLETAILEHPSPTVIQRVHRLKHDILRLRRELRPLRELVAGLLRTDHDNISDTSRLFLRDVHDHCIQVQDMLETQRDSVAGLAEAYLNATSYRLTQVMKVLTIISTVFMPLSFLAGVYGMNFQFMPEIQHPTAYPWSYPIGFWGLALAISGTMVFYFKRQRWI